MQMLITVSAPGGADSAEARMVAIDIVDRLRRSPNVLSVASAWTTTPWASAQLLTKDGKAGLIVADIKGGEDNAPTFAEQLADEVVHDRDGVTVRAGGVAIAYGQIIDQVQRDLLVMEGVAIPLSFIVLVWVFGGLLAAAVPLTVGVMVILSSMAALRAITVYTDVSVFALNLSAGFGFALAIDYTLLVVSRFRDERSDGAGRDEALIRTMATAGRTVLFSATTVALSMAVLVLFPMYFLRSFAYAGIATVAFAAIAAVVVTPAAIVLLGDRLDSLDVRRLIHSRLHSPGAAGRPVEELFWYRSTKIVMRHAIPIGMAGVALLVLLGLPFLGVKWGFPDDRVLPPTSSAHEVGDQLREDFVSNLDTAVTVVIPEAGGVTPAELERYAADLSRVGDVAAVSAPSATFVAGAKVGPPSAAAGRAGGSVFLTVASSAPLFSKASKDQLDALHAVSRPGGEPVEFTGRAQINHDTVAGMTARLPLVLGLMGTVTFVLLFLLTGSLLLPVKALLLNVLSLSAAFGALVWIFQLGHLGALGTSPSGTLPINIPIMLFCLAFGLSMDYEVFLVSRIREYWLASGCTDSDESVALGLGRTGRVITAAAAIMAIAFAGLIAGQVSFLRMVGLGLALAVLMDATLVRLLLVPSFMHVLGRWNWWAPGPLAWLHSRIGISESPR
jgi:putative drug exporter of the RND superfamily